jgi:peptidoglycan hydrolase-like protein with peptidoglycan-binding domain
MFRPLVAIALLLALCLGTLARAQDGQVWVQIEAQPNLAEAEARARAYAAVFPETNGFQLRSGWYGIMLGPYTAAQGNERLAELKAENLIPQDSFIAFASNFGDPFWPASGTAPLPVEPEVTSAPEPEPVALPDETRAEARDSEVMLSDEDRLLLQTALQWFGFYNGAIDGDYGPGTRNSMAAWQEAQAIEPTGILTTRQRATLIGDYRGEIEAFGFAPVAEADSGIEITLPLALVEFDHYEPPFVHYRAKAGSDLRIVLISQPGDQSNLSGLYDILQTLDAVPLTGDRSRGEKSFRIRGTSGTIDTTAYAELTGGLIKGWMLISSPGNDARDARILRVLETTFRSASDRALDPGMVAMSGDTRAGLLSGLEVRKPKFSRSGFFVDATGTVLTTTDAVAGCGRITIDRTQDAGVTLSDAATGLAILTPKTPLSPRTVAQFQIAADRIGTEIALAGYSYEDRLPAPVLTFGTLEDSSGLNGEPGLKRLAIEALAGDTGGPVLDSTGAVVGMLLPIAPGGKQLPPGIFFATSAAQIASTLTAAGITPLQSGLQGAMAPEDLTQTATGMTVLVSCWN